MRKHLGLSLTLSAVGAVVAVIVVSCGGGTGGGPAERTPQFVLDPAGTSSNAATLTMSVDRTSIDANNADRINVTAQVLDQFRQPLIGQPITFQASFGDVQFLTGSPQPSSSPIATGTIGFPSAIAITDGNGVATITVKSGATPGRLALNAFSRTLDVSGLIFVNLTDVGFISGNLQVIPAEIDVKDPDAGTQLEFVIVGGQPFRAPSPPYLLQNATSAIGVAELLDDGTFPVVIRYTIGGMEQGPHVFSIVDAQGNSVTATVMVEFTPLTITPAAASLTAGQTQVFSLTGGVPPYTCTPSGGTLDPTTITTRGGTTTFTAGDQISTTSYTIICTDAAGQVASATVSVSPMPTPSGGGGGTPSPQTITKIVVSTNPPTLNGVQGGTSTVTATVLDQNNNPIPSVNVLFTLPAQGGNPTPTVPSLSPLTAFSDANGQAITVLTVPAGTSPQFIVIDAAAGGGVTGSGQVGVTSQTGSNPGPPARLNAALFKANTFGDNNDGTLTTILSALVSDINGNPVIDGVQVNWGPVNPAGVTINSPSFTDGLPQCDTTSYTRDSGLAITPQPGTALTCLTYPRVMIGQIETVTVKVNGTSLSVTTSIILPGPVVAPTPTPAPPPPTPSPSATPPAPMLVPGSANVTVGQSVTFAVTSGLPPYNIIANGGTAVPTTVNNAGGTFQYTATQAGSFTVLATDSLGRTAQATVNNTSAITASPNPICVSPSGSQVVTLTGGTAPYTISVTGLAGSLINASAPPISTASPTFTYSAPVASGNGSLVITDSASPTANSLTVPVKVNAVCP